MFSLFNKSTKHSLKHPEVISEEKTASKLVSNIHKVFDMSTISNTVTSISDNTTPDQYTVFFYKALDLLTNYIVEWLMKPSNIASMHMSYVIGNAFTTNVVIDLDKAFGDLFITNGYQNLELDYSFYHKLFLIWNSYFYKMGLQFEFDKFDTSKEKFYLDKTKFQLDNDTELKTQYKVLVISLYVLVGPLMEIEEWNKYKLALVNEKYQNAFVVNNISKFVEIAKKVNEENEIVNIMMKRMIEQFTKLVEDPFIREVLTRKIENFQEKINFNILNIMDEVLKVYFKNQYDEVYNTDTMLQNILQNNKKSDFMVLHDKLIQMWNILMNKQFQYINIIFKGNDYYLSRYKPQKISSW